MNNPTVDEQLDNLIECGLTFVSRAAREAAMEGWDDDHYDESPYESIL